VRARRETHSKWQDNPFPRQCPRKDEKAYDGGDTSPLTWWHGPSRMPLSPVYRMHTNLESRHEVQFYSSDSVLLETFAGFIANALASRNAVIVLATKSHREDLAQKLTAAGLDLDGAREQGLYIALDAAEMLSTFMVDGAPDRLRFFEGLCGLIESAIRAAKTGHPRVAICGECVGLLCAEGNVKAAIRLEEVGNDVAELHNVEIMCAYPLSSFHEEHADAFERICAQHTAVYSR